MKTFRYFPCLLASAALLSLVACEQDLEQNPAFNYPMDEGASVQLPEPLYHAAFEENLALEGSLAGEMTVTGGKEAVFVAGKTSGKAYKGSDDAALLIRPDAASLERLKNLGSFSTFCWINFGGGNKSAVALFSIAHQSQEIGNVSWFIDGTSADDPSQFFFKGYLRSTGADGQPDSWFDAGNDARITNMAGKWRFVGVTYDAETSKFTLYNQGTEVCSRVLREGGLGALKFDAVSGICLGAFPSMVGLSDVESWPKSGTFFNGILDDFYLYDKALSAAEVSSLYEKTK